MKHISADNPPESFQEALGFVMQAIQKYSPDEETMGLMSFFVMAGFDRKEDLNKILVSSEDKEYVLKLINKAIVLAKGDGYQLMGHSIDKPITEKAKNLENYVIRMMQSTFDLLKQNIGVDCYITSGTLLGYIREEKFLSHDDDLDAAYVSKYTDIKKVIEERMEIFEFLKAQPHILVTDAARATLGVRVHENGARIDFDLFTAYCDGTYINQYPLEPQKIYRYQVLPLEQRLFYGEKINIPKMPEKCLDVNYGKDKWRIPDPTFRFDFSQFQDFYNFYSLPE